jgi:Holliday junction DNA helicase RuvA
MLTKMTGTLVRVLDDEARVQVGPFEYQVLVPEAVRRQIQMRTGQEITFHVSEYFEGNAGGNRFVPRKIGFLTEAELDFFDLFCTVEKIGAKKALKAMARPVKEIADAIARQDSRWLSTLPGIGATTAEQIVTTLKRKVAQFVMAASAPVAEVEPPPETAVAKPGRKKPAPAAAEPAPAVVDGNVIEDVYQALMALGHNPVEARERVDSLLRSGKTFKSVNDAIGLIYSGNKG